MTESTRPATLVLGIGNVLLSDDGAGIHVVRYLAAHHAGLPGIDYVDGGTLNFLLAPRIEQAEWLLVVDAANLRARPGTLLTLHGEAMDRFLQSKGRSAHEVGLRDLLSMAWLVGRLPRQRALLGIQPASLKWGERLSPAVTAVVPRAAHEVLRLAQGWAQTRA